MPKKKLKSIYECTLEDADFTRSTTREFSLCYPDELDDILKRLQESLKYPQSEPGLTPLEFILRRFEEEARRILTEHGHPTDLGELLWLEDDHTYPVKTRMRTTALKLDVDIESLSAKRVLFSAQNLRHFIAANEAEQAAIEMMRLTFAAISADMFNVLMTGVRAKQGQKKGGHRPKQKQGIMLAIREVLKQKGQNLSRENLWRYFLKNHNDTKGQPAFEVGDYTVNYENDRLFQENVTTDERPESISKATFYKYVSKIRPKTKK